MALSSPGLTPGTSLHVRPRARNRQRGPVAAALVATALAAVIAGQACNALSGVDDFGFDAPAPGSCTVPDDCPYLEGGHLECSERLCVDGACDYYLQPEGIRTQNQPSAVCDERVCDGAGFDKVRPRDIGTTCTIAGAAGHCTGAGVCTTVCDQQGNCGDTDEGCAGCAVEGACADELAACMASMAWTNYANCTVSCGMTPACITDCTLQFPAGAMLDNAFKDCVYCNECPIDCAGSCSD